MKITKYEHACFTLEKGGKSIIVDPGVLSPDFIVPKNVVAIIVTHEHPDHFDPDKLAAIFNDNPESLLIADSSITQKMVDHKTRAVVAGETISLDGFSLEFFGGEHAVIHPSVPVIANLGVLIDEHLYYPGDSFFVPNKQVGVLALPLGAPWLKVSEAIDFMVSVKPKIAFPTHDAVLSKDGQAFHDSWILRFAEPLGIDFKRITGQVLDI